MTLALGSLLLRQPFQRIGHAPQHVGRMLAVNHQQLRQEHAALSLQFL